jgi:hypothetical protein
MAFFAAIWGWITKVVGALLPFSKSVVLSPVVRWIVWIVLDAIVLALLYLLNRNTPIANYLPEVPPQFRDWYLSALGQLAIFMGIVLYWLYVLWFADTEESPFTDIDAAWAEATRALDDAGIRLTRVPVFLILGRPGTSEVNLFDAAGVKLIVKQTPADSRAPLHVFAEREAVYVTCRGASVLGKLAGILAREEQPKTPLKEAESSINPGATEVPWKKEDLLIQEKVRATEGREATTLEKRVMYRASLGKPLGADFLANNKEVATQKARLAHLCRLICRDRAPHCAANGILLLIPLASTDTPGEAEVTAQASKEDLEVARREMKLDCPVLTVLVDMEELPGFADFVQRQTSKQLRNRRGSGFPMSTRMDRKEVLREIRTSLHWVCSTYLQDSIYDVFQNETANNMDVAPLFTGNSRLVLLLAEMNDRADALASIVEHAVASQDLFRYTGCYLAATGGAGSQAFVAGVFEKLAKEQSSVTWTQAAKQEDIESRRWANYYFMIATVLFLAWCGVLAWGIYKAYRG